MNAVKLNDVANVTINGTRLAIHKFRAFTSMRIAAAAMATLSPAAPIIGALLGEGESANSTITTALASLGPSLATLDPRQVEDFARELTVTNGNVFYEQHGKPVNFTESSADELFGGDISHLFALMKEVIELNYGGLFIWLKTLFGNSEEDGEADKVESLT